MSGGLLFTELHWLSAVPADWRRQCKEAAAASNGAGDRLRQLATYRLDLNQLTKLANTMAALRQREVDLSPLSPLRLGLVSNSTVDFLEHAIVASGLRFGLAIELVKADYDQVLQSALDPESKINRARCDAVLVALDYRGLPLSLENAGDASSAGEMVEAALRQLETITSAVRRNSGAVCLVQTIARPPETLFGNADRTIAGSWLHLAGTFNQRLAAGLPRGDALVDVAALAETVGLANWHDPKQWNLAKLPFALDCVPLYADHVCRVLGAMRGKSRRTLVLDLDNTVWSGVIGDDGLQGIGTSQGDATGEAHLSLQAEALALRKRGIVLAVASKNDEEVALLPFQKHPDMLLREEHIAVFQANWKDKATNLSAIANELNLGIDSLVFIDDNPFERNFVRESLTTVAVPELPEDPALYARTLAAAGYFEGLSLSEEDKERSNFYQNNARRAALQNQVGDLAGYLVSLEMEIDFQAFDDIGRSRVAQLINKSNQFNLTTRRYTEAEIQAIEEDPGAFGLQVRLRDKFGDNGMISVLICRRRDDTWELDTWLMSCRVLGRRVEEAVLRELLLQAQSRGVRQLEGRYLPSGRNSMVRDHYEKLGFVKTEEKDSGETTWVLDAGTAIAVDLPMKVTRGPETTQERKEQR